MPTIIVTIIFAVLSTLIGVLMICTTNKKLTNISSQDIEITNSKPYHFNWVLFVVLAIIASISAFCGYRLSNSKLSWVAMIELGSCYMAVLAAAVIDLKTRTIPNYIPLSLIILRFIVLLLEFILNTDALGYMVSSILGCLLCAFVLVIANRLSKGGIGGGDIKLLSAVGFMCGIYVVCSTMLLALVACVLTSFILLAARKCTRKDSVPFGPFIWIGFLAVCLLKMY